MVTYTATFGSMDAPEGSAAASDPDSSSDASPSLPISLPAVKRPLMIGGLVVVLIAGGAFVFKKIRERR